MTAEKIMEAKYHLPAEHNGGGNNETQRNHTDIKQRRIFIQRHKEPRCHFIQSASKNSLQSLHICFKNQYKYTLLTLKARQSASITGSPDYGGLRGLKYFGNKRYFNIYDYYRNTMVGCNFMSVIIRKKCIYLIICSKPKSKRVKRSGKCKKRCPEIKSAFIKLISRHLNQSKHL